MNATAPTTTVSRPGVVTFIGVVIFIQALIDAVTAVVTWSRMSDALWLAGAGFADKDAALWNGILHAAFAVILFVLWAKLRAGGRGARGLITFVWAIRLIVGVGMMVWYPFAEARFHHGVAAVLIGWWVIWALNSNDKAQDFFGD